MITRLDALRMVGNAMMHMVRDTDTDYMVRVYTVSILADAWNHLEHDDLANEVEFRQSLTVGRGD